MDDINYFIAFFELNLSDLFFQKWIRSDIIYHIYTLKKNENDTINKVNFTRIFNKKCSTSQHWNSHMKYCKNYNNSPPTKERFYFYNYSKTSTNEDKPVFSTLQIVDKLPQAVNDIIFVESKEKYPTLSKFNIGMNIDNVQHKEELQKILKEITNLFKNEKQDLTFETGK